MQAAKRGCSLAFALSFFSFIWAFAAWNADAQNLDVADKNLQALLESSNPELRAQGIEMLKGADAEQAQKLVAALEDPAALVRLSAAKTLCRSADAEIRHQAFGVLGALLSDQDAAIREQTLRFLADLGVDAEPAAQRIQVALHKGLLGPEAIDVLANIGTQHAVSGIANVVTYQDEQLKKAAVVALGKLGPKAQPEVEMLIRALEDKQIAGLVLESLAQIRSARALSGVMLPLRGADKDLKLKAISTLKGLKTDAWPAVPALVRAAGDSDPEISQAAQGALGIIRGDAGRENASGKAD